MTTQTPPSGLLQRLAQGSLVKQILIGLVLGVLLALVSKPAAIAVGLLGTLFVGALKAVAPVLVLMLVMASIANHQQGQKKPASVRFCSCICWGRSAPHSPPCCSALSSLPRCT